MGSQLLRCPLTLARVAPKPVHQDRISQITAGSYHSRLYWHVHLHDEGCRKHHADALPAKHCDACSSLIASQNSKSLPMPDLCVIAVLGDLGLSGSMRIPEHRQVIAPGRQLALTAGDGALQGCMIAFQVPMLRQKGLRSSEDSSKSNCGVMEACQKLSNALHVCALGCIQFSAGQKVATGTAEERVLTSMG